MFKITNNKKYPLFPLKIGMYYTQLNNIDNSD